MPGDMKMSSQGTEQRTVYTAFEKAVKAFAGTIPQLAGIVLLIGLLQTFVTGDIIAALFTGSPLTDTVIGSAAGSIATSNPITSYILGGELIEMGVSILAATAFIVAWVTVGLVQLPVEASLLGARFAIFRNAFGFILSIGVALASVATLRLIS
jgi:uncharacterized membrane protein YraQ (UPF0718 family)